MFRNSQGLLVPHGHQIQRRTAAGYRRRALSSWTCRAGRDNIRSWEPAGMQRCRPLQAADKSTGQALAGSRRRHATHQRPAWVSPPPLRLPLACRSNSVRTYIFSREFSDFKSSFFILVYFLAFISRLFRTPI